MTIPAAGADDPQSASSGLRVAPVALELNRLQAPLRVKPSARTVTITVAASTAATLRVGGKRFSIGTRAKRLTVPLPGRPRTGALRLTLVTKAGGRTLRTRVLIVRV